MLQRAYISRNWGRRLNFALDAALYRLSAFGLPIVVTLVSVVALLSWDSYYPTAGARPLTFRYIESSQNWSPQEAAERFESRPRVSFMDTQRSENAFWISFVPHQDDGAEPQAIEFPSRHAISVRCWDAPSLRLLGDADRRGSEGKIAPSKAGFALRLDPANAGNEVLCRTQFVGPARENVSQWPLSRLEMAAREFDRNSGLLDGGLLTLALFTLITAIIVRKSLYLMFSAWLILNLRVGALSAGWDAQWLGMMVPQDWVLEIRLVTTSIYYVLTVTLFRALFREDLEKVGYAPLLNFAQWTCIPLVALSAVLSYAAFLPFLWIATGLSSLVLVFFLARILLLTRSPVAIWYSASIGVTLAASLYEVLAASFGFKGLIGAVNSVTAAISSSILAALAIAEQMRLEHMQRLDVQAELEHTYEAMPIGLFTVDLDGRFVSANPAFRNMLGNGIAADLQGHWNDCFGENAWERLRQLVSRQADGELEIEGTHDFHGAGPKRFLVKAALARGKIEGSLQDVTEKSKATENLLFMAEHDPLTKVFNRRGIEKNLNIGLQQLSEGKPLALAYLDLDRFKLINDLYGHTAGDEVLKQVCDRIGAMLNGAQRIGRVGGDEFVIILPDTSIPLATWICRGITASIGNAPYRIGDKAFQVRGSIGLIEVSPGTPIKDAIATADRACREAKTSNHDGPVVYRKNAAAFREHEAELSLVERLSTSEMTDSLFVEMQPIMSLKTPFDSLNFEVLVRMYDVNGDVIPAYRLIRAAENSGRIGIIDRWVMATTLAWLDTNFSRLARTQFVCMNLSGASLNDERFIQDAKALLAQNAHVAGRLCIEITESVALHDLGNTRRFIDQVRSYGVKIGLDDFGAGYTSFSYLKDLPADVLKIDGSFIVNMNAHPANVAIVEAIVSLARNLGLRTIAEWAEDGATVETLAEIGVDYVQGYAVSRPQSPQSLLAATSSAHFIQDKALLAFVRTLGSTTVSQ
jgi:diguanylate cyclase (GGDEF)-like protein/PAS domain S-box-containing protein